MYSRSSIAIVTNSEILSRCTALRRRLKSISPCMSPKNTYTGSSEKLNDENKHLTYILTSEKGKIHYVLRFKCTEYVPFCMVQRFIKRSVHMCAFCLHLNNVQNVAMSLLDKASFCICNKTVSTKASYDIKLIRLDGTKFNILLKKFIDNNKFYI